MAFIELEVSNTITWHGYDSANKEIIEATAEQPRMKKTVAIARIQSLSEKYVLVSSGFGRYAYWEYHDGYDTVKARLRAAGKLIE